MEWINPHSWIHIEVKRPNGTIERWAIEGGPPNALFRRGFTRQSLPNGVEIVVEDLGLGRKSECEQERPGKDVEEPLDQHDDLRVELRPSGTAAA